VRGKNEGGAYGNLIKKKRRGKKKNTEEGKKMPGRPTRLGKKLGSCTTDRTSPEGKGSYSDRERRCEEKRTARKPTKGKKELVPTKGTPQAEGLRRTGKASLLIGRGNCIKSKRRKNKRWGEQNIVHGLPGKAKDEKVAKEFIWGKGGRITRLAEQDLYNGVRGVNKKKQKSVKGGGKCKENATKILKKNPKKKKNSSHELTRFDGKAIRVPLKKGNRREKTPRTGEEGSSSETTVGRTENVDPKDCTFMGRNLKRGKSASVHKKNTS